VEPEPRITYLVRLADYPHPAADAVKVAEQCFRRELDRQLGNDWRSTIAVSIEYRSTRFVSLKASRCG